MGVEPVLEKNKKSETGVGGEWRRTSGFIRKWDVAAGEDVVLEKNSKCVYFTIKPPPKSQGIQEKT